MYLKVHILKMYFIIFDRICLQIHTVEKCFFNYYFELLYNFVDFYLGSFTIDIFKKLSEKFFCHESLFCDFVSIHFSGIPHFKKIYFLTIDFYVLRISQNSIFLLNFCLVTSRTI
jgi:hypothetical protein